MATECGAGNAHVVVGDVSKEAVQKQLIQETLDKFGSRFLLFGGVCVLKYTYIID